VNGETSVTQLEERLADSATIARCAAGCSASLELLYDRHAATCLGHARSVLRDTDHAEDAVQEAFLDLWRHAHRYDARQCSVRSWLLMLTHRKAVDRVRSEQLRRTTQLGPQDDRPDAAPSPDLQALTAVLGEQVRDALARLPHVKREALVLAYWGGYTQREIAALTDAPLGTVKTRMYCALKDLHAVLSRPPEGERQPAHVVGVRSNVG
jgi:RNA polymerase sigma-70 factor (ECF subfamily)